MFASYIEAQFKPGTWNDAVAAIDKMEPELRALPGFRHFTILDRGDDKATVIGVYESKELWEEAGPIAQQLLGSLGPFLAAMPERVGCGVIADF